MDLREVFATNLRRLRHAKGLSQDDLAYEAEVSRSYLAQLEKGSYYASLKIVGRLADALGVEPEEPLRHNRRQAGKDWDIAYANKRAVNVGKLRPVLDQAQQVEPQRRQQRASAFDVAEASGF